MGEPRVVVWRLGLSEESDARERSLPAASVLAILALAAVAIVGGVAMWWTVRAHGDGRA